MIKFFLPLLLALPAYASEDKKIVGVVTLAISLPHNEYRVGEHIVVDLNLKNRARQNLTVLNFENDILKVQKFLTFNIVRFEADGNRKTVALTLKELPKVESEKETATKKSKVKKEVIVKHGQNWRTKVDLAKAYDFSLTPGAYELEVIWDDAATKESDVRQPASIQASAKLNFMVIP